MRDQRELNRSRKINSIQLYELRNQFLELVFQDFHCICFRYQAQLIVADRPDSSFIVVHCLQP